jgi:spermidine/putrescine transport system substrate-binding protein
MSNVKRDTTSGKGTLTRRDFLRQSAAGAAVFATASVGPWFVRNALCSSGTLVLYSWSDYIYQDMIDDFEKKTGIKVKLVTYGTNDEVLNKLRTSQAKGFDIVMPSVTYGEQYYKHEGLLMPLDESIINVSGCKADMWSASENLGGTHRRKRYLIPFNWGTEAVTFDSDAVTIPYGELSYGSIWQPEFEGKVTVRAHSSLLGIGLYLDAIGKVPSNRMLDTYETPEKMRAVYEECTKFAIENKKQLKAFWSNAQETTNAYMQNGCVIGQTWDGPAGRLYKETNGRIRYMAPKEGALTWMDSMGIPGGAENVEQAYAFINWYYTPEAGAMHANNSGYNSCSAGAEALLEETNVKFFKEAYPGGTAKDLWWYPVEPTWFVSVRNEFRDKYLAA